MPTPNDDRARTKNPNNDAFGHDIKNRKELGHPIPPNTPKPLKPVPPPTPKPAKK